MKKRAREKFMLIRARIGLSLGSSKVANESILNQGNEFVAFILIHVFASNYQQTKAK